jgi:signal transduction histidine kinase
MASSPETPIGVLRRFGRLLSEAAEPDAITALLADAAVEHIGADGVAVLRVSSSGELCVVAGRGLPHALASFRAEPDAIGSELGEAIRTASDGLFRGVHWIPLVGGGGLFGALVLLFASDSKLDADRALLAEAVADLAASGLSAAEQHAVLRRSYVELRASREVLARGQKLRALGQMAAGVAHDLKNIINPLSLHLQFLKRATPREAEDAQQSLLEMQQVLRRGLETIDRLRSFSRQSPGVETQLVDLNQLAREAIQIARPRTRGQHDVHYQLGEKLGDPPLVKLVASEAVAVIVNLLVNAIEAMPAGGTITVTTANEREGGLLRIEDDGPGMTPEVEARVFEPFFTTKGDEGTGLGLALAYAFAERSGGHLTLETAPGRGALFSLWFPKAQ